MTTKQPDKAHNDSLDAPKKQRVRVNQNRIYRLIGEIDRPMLIIVIALVCIGSVMIFSASYAVGESRFNDSYYFARSQVRWVALGILFMALIAKMLDYRVLKRFAYIIYGAVLFLNYLVPFFGETNKGATRWFVIFGVEFQPSELLKFALVLACAAYISNHASEMKTLRKGALPLLLLTLPAAGATLLQSHLSATIIILLLMVVMMWLSGLKAVYFGIVMGIGVTAATFFLTVGRNILAKIVPHAITRLDIWEDPFKFMSYESGGAGWQPAQSLYAISSGGFWGLGLGQSNQKHGYLPEPQNDYIFAILAEELGFFGVICVIALFGALAFRGYYISKNAPNRFSSLIAMGITAQIVVQVLLNLAVVTNTFPSTGISLPFFSYGGTSLIILLAEMGVVLSISRYSFIEQG
ncbi:MAG: cell division protein FtsW [Clostridia bacterium]|nr:cell division protein FtsW [Clostridia bacterium]MBQ5837737.1 cell division protein FtsW [Clostridia bacterium]